MILNLKALHNWGRAHLSDRWIATAVTTSRLSAVC